MSTLAQFAFMRGYFKIPEGLDQTQLTVFHSVVDWFNKSCFENPEWNSDQDVSHVFEFLGIELRRIEMILDAVDQLFQLVNTRLHWSNLGNEWTLKVVSMHKEQACRQDLHRLAA